MSKIQSITHNTIEFKGLVIKHICNPKLKNSYINIDKNAQVSIKTPKVSSLYIQNLLCDKELWIRKKISKLQENPPLILNLEGINTKESKEYLRKKVDNFSRIMNLSYSDLKFRKMKNRWGSCTNKGVITLNKKLIKTPEICIDYVVVHELAHIIHMNHSKKFHLLVENYIHNAKEAKELLSRVVFE